MNVTLQLIAPTLTFALAAVTNCAASDVAGTYELLICKHACSFEHPGPTFAKGVIVLFDEPMSPQEIKRVDPFFHSWQNEVIRACFSGKQTGHLNSFAFISTNWRYPLVGEGPITLIRAISLARR